MPWLPQRILRVVTGSFSIDENHNPVKAIVVISLKDGKQHTSEKVSQ